MTAFNPYAPPLDLPVPPPDRPLPEGIRRYRLDREGSLALLQRAALNRLVFSGVLGLLFPIFQARRDLAAFEIFLVVWVGVFTFVYVVRRAGARRLEPRVTAAFELLSSPRALRRAAFGVPPAEIAAVEVQSLAELPDGLSIVSETRRLWIPRAVIGYAELRDRLSAWGSIETLSGPTAFFRRYRPVRLHRAYDLARDGAIAREPSLHGELEALRAVALSPIPVPKRTRRILLLWLLLIVLFLAIWQFLSPAPPRARPQQRQPAPPALSM